MPNESLNLSLLCSVYLHHRHTSPIREGNREHHQAPPPTATATTTTSVSSTISTTTTTTATNTAAAVSLSVSNSQRKSGDPARSPAAAPACRCCRLPAKCPRTGKFRLELPCCDSTGGTSAHVRAVHTAAADRTAGERVPRPRANNGQTTRREHWRGKLPSVQQCSLGTDSTSTRVSNGCWWSWWIYSGCCSSSKSASKRVSKCAESTSTDQDTSSTERTGTIG